VADFFRKTILIWRCLADLAMNLSALKQQDRIKIVSNKKNLAHILCSKLTGLMVMAHRAVINISLINANH
jgi:hypothetical protein